MQPEPVLTVHNPGVRLVATEISPAALAVARQNFARHGVSGRVEIIQTDLLFDAHGPFDLICANLPYIPSATLAGLPIGRFEPRPALDGGPDGLRLVERALAQIPARLAPGGLALFEIEAALGGAASTLARKYLPTAEISVHKDLAGRDRLLEIQQPPSPEAV
jgi:release factor glutamine methyltransferase